MVGIHGCYLLERLSRFSRGRMKGMSPLNPGLGIYLCLFVRDMKTKLEHVLYKIKSRGSIAFTHILHSHTYWK